MNDANQNAMLAESTVFRDSDYPGLGLSVRSFFRDDVEQFLEDISGGVPVAVKGASQEIQTSWSDWCKTASMG
eukprot:7290135-Pyramimonas_sp.AAC.1